VSWRSLRQEDLLKEGTSPRDLRALTAIVLNLWYVERNPSFALDRGRLYVGAMKKKKEEKSRRD